MPRRGERGGQSIANERTNSQRKLNTRERELLCLELRLAGDDQVTIARKLNIHHTTVSRAIRRAIDKRTAEKADQLVQLMHQRIEKANAGIWQRIERGDLPAIDRAIKLWEREARLFGLDAPTKQSIDTTLGGSIEYRDHTDTSEYKLLIAGIMKATADNPEMRYALADILSGPGD